MEFDGGKNLSVVIESVIRDRVYKFNQEQIDMVIRVEMNKLQLGGYHSSYYWECYFKVLDYLIDKRELLEKNSIYIPVETKLNDYYDVNSSVLTYSNGLVRGGEFSIDDNEEIFDVSTCEALSRMEVNIIKPIVLTGYLEGDGNYKKPDVSIEEISELYRKFINQGASVDEAIQYILNYYNAVLLSNEMISEKYPNRYKISPKVKSRTKWFY